MDAITIEEYNALAEAGKIIDIPVADNTAQILSTTLRDEDDVQCFRIGNAIALYWGGCGHLNTVYINA